MAGTIHDQNALRNFRFDTRDADWKDFITPGCYYKLLDVNVGARTADMIVKFDPGARCMYRRHVAPCTSCWKANCTLSTRPAPARNSE